MGRKRIGAACGFRVVLGAAAGALSLLWTACGAGPPTPEVPGSRDGLAAEREAMVRQIEARGVEDPAVLAAMRAVPRHEFVPPDRRRDAYRDSPLPIGHGQTISQPYVVAFMTQALQLRAGEKVLEIGTGSGYQAAVLARLGCVVFSIEIVAPLAETAAATLRATGHDVQVRAGDGYRGWPEAAPFDAVIVTAAPDHVPRPLVDQLRVGGRMILPVGEQSQDLVLLEKTATGTTERRVLPVRFVPMTGTAQERGR
jgi:protein-L-isoaspartate(D-aspartate) O-methyltransferase